MAKGHKTGGRAAEKPNRKTQGISTLLEFLGCNPIEGMAQIAMNGAHTQNVVGACTPNSRSMFSRSEGQLNTRTTR